VSVSPRFFYCRSSVSKQTGLGGREVCNQLFRPAAATLQPKRVFSMKASKEELLDIIYQSLDELNEQLPDGDQIQKSPAAPLVGEGGRLDSLGFVNFVALVEEKCAHKYGIALSLTDISSHEDDHFGNLGKFADFLFQCLDNSSL
jgi:acyl carrier protein